jgi:hypothetical protein
MIETTLRFHVELIKRNRLVFFFLLLITGTILIDGIAKGALLKALLYIIAVWGYSFIVDLSCLKNPPSAELPVKRYVPEAIYALTFLVVWLAHASYSGATLTSWLMVFPVVYFISVLRKLVVSDNYTMHELGFRSEKTAIAIPVLIYLSLILVLSFSYLSKMAGLGYLAIVTTLFNTLMIEFFRMLGQSRLAVIMKNFGYVWVIITIGWGILFFPSILMVHPNLSEAVLRWIRILPAGLLFGYITYRTNNFLPSALLLYLTISFLFTGK